MVENSSKIKNDGLGGAGTVSLKKMMHFFCPKNCFLSLPKRLQKDHQTPTSGLPKWKCKCLKRFRWIPQCLNRARIYKCYHVLKVYPLKLLELNLNHTLLANILGQSKIGKVFTVVPALVVVSSVSLQLVASSCSIKQLVSSKYQNKKPCDKSLSHTVANQLKLETGFVQLKTQQWGPCPHFEGLTQVQSFSWKHRRTQNGASKLSKRTSMA